MQRLFVIFILSLFSINAYALTCNDVDGSYVYSPDGTYLGFFGNQYASDSISNDYGTYGNEYNTLSMKNSFGTYGNPYGVKSATNPYALSSNVPILFKYETAIAYITANTFTAGGVSLDSLLACGSSASFPATSAPDPVPSAVTDFAASQGTSSSNVFLAWTSSSYATSYDVYNSTSSSGTLNFLGNTTSTSTTIQNVSAGTTYYYFVYPKNSSGTGSGVYTTGFAGSSAGALPSLSASNGLYTDKIVLTWGAAAGADTYLVKVADTVDGIKTDLGYVSGTTATITDATPGVTFYYSVYPYNSICLDCINGQGRVASGYIAAASAPNEAPVVAITGGNRSISDTDSTAGETVSFTATATDEDGDIDSTSWLVGGEVVASGTSADLSLSDGSTTVTFRATDDDGGSTSTSVTITVAAPVSSEIFKNLDSVQLGELDIATIAALGADQVAELAAETVTGLKPNQLSNLAADAVSGFDSSQVKNISVETIAGLNAEQMSNLTKEALSGMTVDQFGALEANALGGLKAENIGGLGAEVISAMSEDVLANLDATEVEKMAGEDFSKLVTNLNKLSVALDQVAELLPEGWEIDADGDLSAPPGAGLSFTELKKTASVEGEAAIVALPDFSKNLSLGGGTGDDNVLEGLDKGLEAANVTGVGFTQRIDGVLNIGAAGEAPIAAFIPDTSKMVQAAVGTKVGVTLDEKTGGYVVTTSQGYQIPLLPSLANPTEVSNLLPSSTIVIGSGGQTSISNIEDQNGVPVTIAGIANPILETSDLAAGVYRYGSGAGATIQIVFEDGTAQTLKPVINDQVAFESAARALGVEDIVFKVDGSVLVSLGGVNINLMPLFEIEEGAEGTKVTPEIKIEDGRYFVISSDGDKQEFVAG